MSEWTIYFNSKCGSCRKALEILKKRKINPVIVEYLKTPPSLKTLDSICKAIGGNVEDMIRKKEPIFEELGLEKGNESKEEWLKTIEKHPILLQRPIVVKGTKGVVARPPEKVEELF
jgi:arsenate reductase